MKTCTKCGEGKPLEEFAWRNKSKGRKHSWCKECHRNADKYHYYNGTRKAQVRERTERIKEYQKGFVSWLKLRLGCKRCGYNKYSQALDLHHLRDKDDEIANLYGCSMNKVKKELRKCVVLCATCHREVHIEERLCNG